MKKQEKEYIVSDLTSKMREYSSIYIFNHIGMTVKEMDFIRKQIRSNGMYFKVVKNTFLRKALESFPGVHDGLEDTLHGVSAIMFSNHPNLPAKIIKHLHSINPVDARPVFKGASIDGFVYIGAQHFDTLINLKSREELLADVIYLLQSPIRNVLSGLRTATSSRIHNLLASIQSK